jgi:hypothetical protein
LIKIKFNCEIFHLFLVNKTTEGEEYVNVDLNKVENTYDVYEASPSQINTNICPYTGLPAAHLKLMNSPQVGLLTKKERKLFFAQGKDFYAGILGKWILLYPSKSNDMKPSEYFCPLSFDVEKAENHFSIVTEKGKKLTFQAPNVEEFSGWLENLRNIVESSIEMCQIREKESTMDQNRKLPSPPLEIEEECIDSIGDRTSSEDYYGGFNRCSNQTVINTEERLYEEPTRSIHETDVKIDSCDDNANPPSPPCLPAKTGRKTIVEDDETHSYDIPKPTKSIERDDMNFNESEMSDKSRSKVSEMTAILSTTINLVSPEEKRKSSPKKIPSIENHQTHETTTNEKRASPMKTWFTKHMKIRRRKREKTPIDLSEEENEDPSMNTTVNSIVNMFEKNGHFKNLSKNLKTHEDYETVCIGSYKI